jgi:adenylate cyclase
MRVYRCFAFMDISGFTALTETRGDEAAVALLSQFRTRVREMCSRRGVRIAKWLGDGAMLVGVETTPILEATLELQAAVAAVQRALPIRCGVTAGDVILHEGDDYIGHAVNIAARLCEIAPGGEVWATPNVVPYLPRWGAVLSEDEVTLRGLEHPMPVARLGLATLEGSIFRDPICGIPLTVAVADTTDRDARGNPLLFCSASCRDTWDRRPKPLPDGQGSLRIPLIGS